jgi:CIC family chloride channel protein
VRNERASFRDLRGRTQPNVDRSLSELTPQFWMLTVATGIAAGVGAILMVSILRAVQHAAFSYHSGEYSTAAAAQSDLRRVLVVTAGGVVAGVGWWLIRRFLKSTGGSPTRALWEGHDDLSLSRTLVSGALSEVVIGMGASLGREAAPQHAGAAFGSWIARRFEVEHSQRMLLIACGAGAGVGAVYNVPLAGALFAAEVYLGSMSLATVVPALVTSAVATVVAWIALPAHAVYAVPSVPYPSASLLVWAVLAGPVIGVAAAAFIRMVAWASDHRPTGGWRLLLGPPAAFAILGALSIAYPLLLGNGRDLAQFAFTGGGALGTLAVLAILKPVVTSLCLRSGASGGLFTPTLSLGAVLGAFLGHSWGLLWPGTSATSYAIVGAAAMLAAGMQAPVAAIAFVIELTGSVNPAIVAIVLAVGGALLVARRLESRSIYSARLPRPQATPSDPQDAARVGASNEVAEWTRGPAAAPRARRAGTRAPGREPPSPARGSPAHRPTPPRRTGR